MLSTGLASVSWTRFRRDIPSSMPSTTGTFDVDRKVSPANFFFEDRCDDHRKNHPEDGFPQEASIPGKSPRVTFSLRGAGRFFGNVDSANRLIPAYLFFHPLPGQRVLPGNAPTARGEQEQVAKNNPAKTCRYYLVFPVRAQREMRGTGISYSTHAIYGHCVW